jgi:uncharacterized protein
MTKFTDRLKLDDSSIRMTADGYLVADIRAARIGIQEYSGVEVGKPNMKVVTVYRPPESVFEADSLRSYAYRPVVVGHPTNDSGMVDASNWRDLARGLTGGDVARDGDYVRVPLVLMDEGAIKTVKNGTREISMGYDAVIEFRDGKTPDGEYYDAVQTQLRMNHLAIVSAARGGSELRIGDEERERAMTGVLKSILLDGISIETTDQGIQAISKLQRDLQTVIDAGAKTKADFEKRIADLTAALSTKDGELAASKKALEDAKMTPAKLDAAVIARTTLVADARKIAGDDLVIDGKTDAEIRRAAVAKHLGDEGAKAMDDAGIAGAFAFAAKQSAGDGETSRSQPVDSLRYALSGVRPTGDSRATADAAYDKYVAELESGYKKANGAAAGQ